MPSCATVLHLFEYPSEPVHTDELDPQAYLDRVARSRIDPTIAEIFGREMR